MNLKSQAVFAVVIQIWVVCLILIFSNKFGMGFEHELLNMELLLCPGYAVSFELLMSVIVIFNMLFFGLYAPLRARF